MRVLIVSEDIPYPSMGGLAKHALGLARALVRAGHQVDILGGDQHPIEVAGDEGNFGGRFFGELHGQNAGWKEGRLGVYMPFKRTVIARRFARIIMRHAANYDVIHYHGHLPNMAAFLPPDLNFVQTRHDQGSDCLAFTRFRDGKICSLTDPAHCAACMTPHPNLLQRAASTAAVVQFRREVTDGFRRHKTVFVSDLLQRNFERTAGKGPWGYTVHNFVDIETLQKASASASPVVPGGAFHVSVAGKIYEAKGVEAFLAELVPRLPADMVVTLAGDGPDEARLRSRFESARVRFLGWCTPERTLEVAAAANAVVMPSLLEEAFGLTTLEGLMLGKPVFALAIGATPELAIYQSAPGQLRLHADMRSLVDDLLTMPRDLSFGIPSLDAGGAERAVHQLLDIYRLPTGQTTR